MKALILSAVAALSASAYAQTCPVGAGGLQINTDQGCVCPSGTYFDSSACASNGVCTGGAFPAPVNTTFNSDGMSLTTVDMTGYDSDVTLTLKVPALQGRNYTNVWIAAPDTEPGSGVGNIGCSAAGAVFKNMTAVAGDTANGRCNDVMSFMATFANLRACGFRVSNLVDTATSQRQTWDGMIRLAYSEPVVVGTGGVNYEQTVTRTATIDYPFRLAFDSQETFQMAVSNVTVFAKQQIDFVILDQVIPRDGSDPTMTLGFTVQYPYTITGWLNLGALTKTGAGSPTNSITAAFDSTAPVCAIGDYIAVGDNTGGNCYKTGIDVTFTKGAASDCSFDGQVYTANFNVRCATGIPEADCPLQATDTGSAEFTITSDNWCADQVTAQNINNVITLTDFYAANVNNFATKQTAWRADDRGYFVITFAGLPMNTIKLTKLERKFGNAGLPGSWTPVADNTGAVEDISFEGLVLAGPRAVSAPLVAGQVGTLDTTTNSGNLGKGSDNLSYYFSAIYNDALLGSGAVAGIVRGADWFLQLQATVDVTYNTTRRRRRQATANSGSGSIESNQQTISAAETAEAAPSSAARTGPVLALALAVLSAVLMA